MIKNVIRSIRRFLDARLVKDALIVGGLLGAITAFGTVYQMGRALFGPGFIVACIALGAIAISTLILYYVCDQLWFRYSDRRIRTERSGRTYAWRIRYAARLSGITFTYFAAIISMKIVRIIGGLAFSILFILLMFHAPSETSRPLHVFSYILDTDALAFVAFGFSAIACAVFGLFAMWEVSIISRVVAEHLARQNQRDLRARKKAQSEDRSGQEHCTIPPFAPMDSDSHPASFASKASPERGDGGVSDGGAGESEGNASL